MIKTRESKRKLLLVTISLRLKAQKIGFDNNFEIFKKVVFVS